MQQTMLHKTHVITYNVRGLKDTSKRHEVFYYLHKKGIHISFLQEVHIEKRDEKFWSAEWGNKICFAHGKNNARGVAILFDRTVDVKVYNVIASESGHYLILYVTYNRHKVVFANIYALNKDEPSFFEDFFHKLEQFSQECCIFGGDLNLAINSDIDRCGSSINNEKAAAWLQDHIAGRNYIDIWRVLHPDKSGFTFRKTRPKKMFSRLNYFFVSEEFLQYVDHVKVNPGYKTDHSMVELIFTFEPYKRDPGYWKMSNSLLSDMAYVERINDILDRELSNVCSGNFKQAWEVTKLTVRGSMIQYSALKRRQKTI